ncbi:MAG: hypothetical protein RMX96_30695 [Nostoc sp. ChiSLP02]|nr:hypothetical protein [Nostoc sp. DedSLP05]MDZ8098029.1 hypothetical protein [Nostoc sp. DedSLP01]MDZ8189195.1 hypothetical protein [Nostoc sp. ChiSLP02]
MLDVPASVIAYLLKFLTVERSLAYLLVKKDGSLLQWGGKLAKYGIINLNKAENIKQQVTFLEGLLPLDDDSLFLPFIKTEYGICVDIHIFSTEEGDWVLFLDSSFDENHLLTTQQEANELSLLQEKSNKNLY